MFTAAAGTVWNAGTVAIVAGCAIPVVAIAGWAIVEIFRIRSSQDLKQRMIDKGMSAADIERILAAKVPGDDNDD
ncbi:MAG: hypothetical protein V3T86_04960 [Planctomycetota bacterium]